MLRLHLFGRARAFADDRPLKMPSLPKTLSLWAYLLLQRTQPLSRDAVAFTFWPDDPEPEARANLRRHLYELRRALPPPAGHPWLFSDGGSLQWNPEAEFWLDVDEFERLSGEPGRLMEAAVFYTGDLLDDLYDDWVVPDRERLRALYFADLGQLIAQYRARQDYAQAIACARLILGQDPLHEATVRELISLRHESGDRPGALQEYQRFEQRLREELGVLPSPETRALHAGLIQDTPQPVAAALPVAAAGRPPRPMAPPPAGEAARAGSLPAQITKFVGREQELEAIRESFGLSDAPPPAPALRARLLTLTGPGGVGKTRLALEAAARLLRDDPARFPGGVFFVALSEILDPALVASAIVHALGIAESGGRSTLDSLTGFLQARQTLLILDNFEQVIEAAPLVGDLLAADAGLHVLATSRILLHVYGERELPVPPLALPDPAHLPPLEELAKVSAVALFLERTRPVRPGFALTDDNAAAVAEICVQLDGLPLAIELVAARGKMLTPQAMLARLSSRLTFLAGAGRARNLAARQQTLRQTIDWSYHLLAEAEQRLFGRLGVFAGAFGLAAAEAITNDEGGRRNGDTAAFHLPPAGLEDTLASLVDQNMLRVVEPAGPVAGPYFSLLFTLREYALERLAESGELDSLRRRHAQYYLALAEQAQPELLGPQQAAWLQRLAAEHDNLRAALEWHEQAAGAEEAGLRLAVALGDFWNVRGYFAEGRRWLEDEWVGRRETPAVLRAQALDAAGRLAWSQNNYPAARGLFEQSLALWRELGPEGEAGGARSLRNQGVVAWSQNQFPLAEQYFQASLEIERRLGSERGIASVLTNLGLVAHGQGDYALARKYYEESLPIARQLKDQRFVGSVLNNLGIAAQKQGEYSVARPLLEESLAICQELGDRQGIASALHNLGNVARPVGDLAAAQAYYRDSLAVYQELGNDALTAYPLLGLGTVASRLGEVAAARNYFERSLSIWHQAGEDREILLALEGMAGVEGAEGRPVRAARLLGAAEALRAAAGTPPRSPSEQADYDRALAAAHAGLDEAEFAAARQAGRALDLGRAVAEALEGNPP